MHLVNQLKQAEQDFEFYPTTDEIIAALIKDLTRPIVEDDKIDDRLPHELYSYTSGRTTRDRERYRVYPRILDIGAGHGKVLQALKEPTHCETALAIEKSELLCQHLVTQDVFIVGTEFHEQSLFTKKADLVFCNPPYSEFEEWAVKIIREMSAHVIYLVLPQRWKSSERIADALKFSDASVHAVGQFTFEDAEDRKARAKVDLLRINVWPGRDPFAALFEEQFADLITKFGPPPKDKYESERRMKDAAERARVARFQSIVVGPTYPEALVSLYDEEMARIQANYRAVGTLDADLLAELEISPSRIMCFLRDRLTNLKDAYWKELFDRLDAITDRLTSSSRGQLLTVLRAHTAIDFTLSNIFTTIIWAINNANSMMGQQLIETYLHMVQKANVQLYKSNQRTFRDDRWRYNSDATVENSHFALDYRIVTHYIGGVRGGSYAFERGLEERAWTFLCDLRTIANNLGFRRARTPMNWCDLREWKAGEKYEFPFIDPLGFESTLFEVRAFRNGNMHFRFDKRFMLALNVEFGRLKGWINTPAEAADELRDPDAAQFFNTLHQLPTSPQLLLAA